MSKTNNLVKEINEICERLIDPEELGSENAMPKVVEDTTNLLIKIRDSILTPQTERTFQRRVVCSAIRHPDGRMVVGPRHYDSTMHALIDMIAPDAKSDDPWYHGEGGFIDQWGKFMDRCEAWKVAEEAGQIKFRCGGDHINGGTLFSENLY